MTSGAIKVQWHGNSGRPVWLIQCWQGAVCEYRVYNHILWGLIPHSKKNKNKNKKILLLLFPFYFMEIAWWADLEGEKGRGMPL